MNHFRIMFLILVLLITYSCSKKDNKEYYDSGKVKCSYQKDEKGQKHGLYTEYYESGQIKSQVSYIHGIKSGVNLSFYENGNIKDYKLFEQDSVRNTRLSFWENGFIKEVDNCYKNYLLYDSTGKPMKMSFWAEKFFRTDGSDPYRTMYFKFDNDQYLNSLKSLIPTVAAYSDTIKGSEKYHLILGLTASFFASENDYYVLVADFNDDFTISDSSTIQKIYPSKGDRNLTLEIEPDNKGINYFKCLICNIRTDGNETKTRYFPISKTYYVE